MSDPRREAVALALADSRPKNKHGQLCPVWTRRNVSRGRHAKIGECDCWILQDAYFDADTALAALTPEATAPDADGRSEVRRPDESDHGGGGMTDPLFQLSRFARHRPWCPEYNGPGDCTCGLYALLDSIRCTCGHKVSVHTDRDVSDVVGWPCSACKSARCTGFTPEATAPEDA